MKRILVVDDDPPVARLIAAALKAAGVEHTLDYCSDGAQGRAKAAQGRYDLITLDLHMPLMGGVEAIREMKRNPKSAHIPVIVITAQKDPAFHKQAMKFGATTLVSKPFKIEELRTILGRVLAGEPVEAPEIEEEESGLRRLGL